MEKKGVIILLAGLGLFGLFLWLSRKAYAGCPPMECMTEEEAIQFIKDADACEDNPDYILLIKWCKCENGEWVCRHQGAGMKQLAINIAVDKIRKGFCVTIEVVPRPY